MEKIRPLWAEIDLDRLVENYRNIKARAEGRRVICVIKADAYGHGALMVAKTLVEAGAEELAVAVITEALELRRGGITAPVNILSYTPEAYFEDVLENDLVVNCLGYDYAKALSRRAKVLGKTARILVSLDTGIGRLGLREEEDPVEVIAKISALPNLTLHGLYTHFATSDERDKTLSRRQLRMYQAAVEALEARGIRFASYHTANSAAVMELSESHLDTVRPGIILYGYYPSHEVERDRLALRPVMQLKSRIIQLKEVPRGTGISYGHTHVTTQAKTLVATLPAGYADGYFRNLSNRTTVLVHGVSCPQIGTICMDHMMVDVTAVPQVREGDVVTLLGEDNGRRFDAEDIAGLLGTIPYEVVCAVSRRVPRVYLRGGRAIHVENYV